MRKYQRAKARIIRDKQAKRDKSSRLYKALDDFESVMTTQNFIKSLRKCQKGVAWKGSVQKFTQNAISEIGDIRKSLLEDGILPSLTSAKRIELYERGKRREIVPITIHDRIIQRVLCDYALVPRVRPTLIYDNGASMKGKGVDFTRKRMEKHLRKAIRRYGADFYALTFDFKNFFDSIPHQICLQVMRKYFTDERIIRLTLAIIRSYQKAMLKEVSNKDERARLQKIIDTNNSVGICLGSQISQIIALVVPNRLDHYIKDRVGVKHYIRYMDDGIIFSDNKEFLHQLYLEMKTVCDSLGLVFNDRKTKVVKVSRGFTFLKVRYQVTVTGKVIKRLAKSGTVRMRRKLKKYFRLVNENRMTLDDVYNSIQSWVAHSKIANSYHTRKNMLILYNDLFDGYKMTKKFNHVKVSKNEGQLQADRWKHLLWDYAAA